jgi:hypothetical protein
LVPRRLWARATTRLDDGLIVLSPCVPLDDGNDDECNTVTELLRGGQMWPVIDAVYPLTASREAFGRLQEASPFGKIRHPRTRKCNGA